MTQTSKGDAILHCPRNVLLALKRCAIEKGVQLQDVTLEAINDYLAKNKHLIEKEIVIVAK